MNKSMLDLIQIVLVRTSHPGNIGASARAMKNMGISRLFLVNPKLFPHEEATARASGAEDILNQAVTTQKIITAIQDCELVVGTSCRPRALSAQTLSVRDCSELMLSQATQGKQVAILFGSERTGLTNQELDSCHYQVHIPCNPEYCSLNLAAAVQVVCYELWQAYLATSPQCSNVNHDLVTSQELELFYVHLQNTLAGIKFLNATNPRQLMRKLRRLFNRIQIEKNELNILRGILTAIDNH